MHVRLGIFWFLFLGGWGVFFPFFSLYLSQELALPPSQVGVVMAMIPLVGLVIQPLWGQLADRTGSRRLVLAVVAAGTGLAALGFIVPQSFPWAVAATATFALFSTSVASMGTSVTLAGVGRDNMARFGQIRMWGTVGFLVLVVIFPRVLERLGETPLIDGRGGLVWMFPAVFVLLALASVAALLLPRAPALAMRSRPGDLKRLARHPPVLRLLVFVFSVHLFIQGPINFFPLYVADRGGNASTVGNMWIFMLIVEIPLIVFSGATLQRLGARGLLRMGLMAEGIRWILCANVTSLPMVSAAQVLHGFGVAGILIGAPLYLEQAVPERLRSTGQALVATVTYGAGAILSNTVFGFLMDSYGVSLPYLLCGVGALVLAFLIRTYLPKPYLPDESVA